MEDLKTFPAMQSVQIKTTIKYAGGASTKGDYRSNSPIAIRPATPVETALAVIRELARLVALEGSGQIAVEAVKTSVENVRDWKIENGYK